MEIGDSQKEAVKEFNISYEALHASRRNQEFMNKKLHEQTSKIDSTASLLQEVLKENRILKKKLNIWKFK